MSIVNSPCFQMPGRIRINGTYWFVLHSWVRMLNSSLDQKATYAKLRDWLIASHPNIAEIFHSSLVVDNLAKQVWLQNQITSKLLTLTTSLQQQTSAEATRLGIRKTRHRRPPPPNTVPFPKAQDYSFQLEISAAARWTSVIGRDGQLVTGNANPYRVARRSRTIREKPWEMSAGNCPIFQNEVLHAVVDRICDMCHEMFRNADPNLRAKCSPTVKFNSIDNNVDRRSTGKKYSINEKGFPMNPNGRTGVEGRGILPFYGPNYVVVSLITRSSKPIEYLAVQNADTDLDILGIPAEFVTMPDSVKITPKARTVIKEIMLKSYANATIEEIFNKVTKKTTLLFRGTLDDERNTDNAWIEVIWIQLADSNVRKLGLVEVEESNNPLGLHWTPLDISELKARLQRLVAQANLSITDSAKQQAREFAWDMRDQGTAGKFKTFVNILANGVTMVNIVLTTASLAG
ncbi:putative nudix hydrolase 6 [Trichinella spiralis]|uniref:Putative nudix hydrolase 6 n=1 Tax=Trichinella spiralis TaxID=6334 RepID=A0A0V1B0M7_TRISP|nr:putative nudix hydrolase 6 [Trichinella spiralis]